MTKSLQYWSAVRAELAEAYVNKWDGQPDPKAFKSGFDAALKLAQEEIAFSHNVYHPASMMKVAAMDSEITKLRAQVAEMKEALEWCADNENPPGECFNRACEVLAKLEGK